MKRFTVFVLAAMTLMPSSIKADGWSRVITTKNEFTDAITAIGSGVAGDTYELVLDYDVSKPLNVGNLKPVITDGRVVIRSNQTEYDLMPILQVGFDWNTDVPDGTKLSLIFENINLQYRSGKEATSGQVVYFNKRTAPIDTVAFRNCEITNIPRTLYRSVPKADEDGVNIAKTLDVFELQDCRVHDMNVSSGNNWFTVVIGQSVNSINISNNVFYDMPYSKGIWQMSKLPDTGAQPIVNFTNNTVLLGSNKTLSPTGFQVMAPTDGLSIAATYNINDNMFIAPQEGLEILRNDTCDYDGKGMILNSDGGLVLASNNIIDSRGFQGLEADGKDAEGNEKWPYSEIKNTYTPEEAGITSWEAGVIFQDPSKSIYYMEKSARSYTMGAEGRPLGTTQLYVDNFPIPATINITIDGPKYITYEVTPVKSQYYVGDEVNIVLNNHNSMRRTFNTFKGWSDGESELARTITLSGDVNLAASFEEISGIIAAFDFSGITSNANRSSYEADIYMNMDEAYKAVIKGYVNDTASTKVPPFTYIEGNFQCRPSKFGEDAVEQQMPIISRRTVAVAKESQRDYVAVEFSTKGCKDIKFSCFVGTDNNAAKTQALDYSLDGSTWTRFAETDIANGIWSELEGILPAELADKDKVYIRIIGDLKNGHVITTDPSGGLVDDSGNENPDAYAASDAFEYVGNILITAGSTNSIFNITKDVKELDENAPIYNVLGIRVTKDTKGILIQNGQKFIVK